jgi:hypothetical protein
MARAWMSAIRGDDWSDVQQPDASKLRRLKKYSYGRRFSGGIAQNFAMTNSDVVHPTPEKLEPG